MLRPNFVFLIKNGVSVQSAKLIKTQKTLDKYIKQYPVNEIQTFSSEEEAIKYINLNNYTLDMQTLKISQKSSDEKLKISQNEEATNNEIINNQFPQEVIDQENTLIRNIQNVEEQQKQKRIADNLYKYYQQNDTLVEQATKKVIKENLYHLFFDGASKSNPGPSGVGYAIFDQNQKLYESSLNTGFKTNNQSEYIGLLYGLKTSLALGIEKLNIYGDSLLIINQMNSVFKVKDEKLLTYHIECRKLRKQFLSTKFQQIPRTQNLLADSLANKGVSLYKKQTEVNNPPLDPENK